MHALAHVKNQVREFDATCYLICIFASSPASSSCFLSAAIVVIASRCSVALAPGDPVLYYGPEENFERKPMSRSSPTFAAFLKAREAASTAFVNGDFDPLQAVSTANSPATIFGPQGDLVQGAEQVNAVNAKGAAHFKPGSTNHFEIIHAAADEHLAYWVGVQPSIVQMHGQEQGVPLDRRVTEIFRREEGAWKLIHRHADLLATNSAEK